jgi:hypothetical protein
LSGAATGALFAQVADKTAHAATMVNGRIFVMVSSLRLTGAMTRRLEAARVYSRRADLSWGADRAPQFDA